MKSSKRKYLILEIVHKLKRSKPSDIVSHFARVEELNEQDPALKRAIQRDLRALVTENLLHVEYFASNGEPIPPGEEEQHAYKRAEYSAIGEKAFTVKGVERFEEKGGMLYTPPILQDVLFFDENYQNIPRQTIVLTFDTLLGQAIHLWFYKADSPLQFLLARRGKEPFSKTQFEQANLNNRAAVLFLPDKTLSRWKYPEKKGHAIVEFSGDASAMTLEDLNSTKGSYHRSVEALDEELNQLIHTQKTMDFSTVSQNWTEVVGRKSLSTPSVLKLGTLQILVNTK